MDLFGHNAKNRHVNQPLAERMRPETLEDYRGQQHLLGPGKLLGRVLAGSELPSLILWGPPGTGKTTLARILAARARAHLAQISAVEAGVRDIRAIVAQAGSQRDQYGHKTILFIDEIHRFSKSQQDALLPHVESGTVTLIGATTENPAFEVNAPLLSRCRVVVLQPLEDDALGELALRALTSVRGLDGAVTLADDVLAVLVSQANGDARRMLNTLEVAASIAPQQGGVTVVTRDALDEAMQHKALVYDKAGEEHYGVISAFIKSMRGSDPDAAVYWMTRMLEAGEDPMFILRRLVIFASEDIGIADPQALGVATAGLDAFRFVGLPEGVLPMTQVAVYLACAPKSNTALTTYAAARRLVREHGALPVPARLRNATSGLTKRLGHGKGYKYPHEFHGNYVAQSYLPEALEGTCLYQPTTSGAEAAIADRVAAWRAATHDAARDQQHADDRDGARGQDDGARGQDDGARDEKDAT